MIAIRDSPFASEVFADPTARTPPRSVTLAEKSAGVLPQRSVGAGPWADLTRWEANALSCSSL